MQSIEDIPTLLVNIWGIDLVVAQVILSTAVLLAIVLPILIVRGHSGGSGFNVEIIGASFGLFICVGLGWLPLWIVLVSLSMTALGIAGLVSNKFGG